MRILKANDEDNPLSYAMAIVETAAEYSRICDICIPYYYEIDDRYVSVINDHADMIVYIDGEFKVGRIDDRFVVIDKHNSFGEDWISMIKLERL